MALPDGSAGMKNLLLKRRRFFIFAARLRMSSDSAWMAEENIGPDYVPEVTAHTLQGSALLKGPPNPKSKNR